MARAEVEQRHPVRLQGSAFPRLSCWFSVFKSTTRVKMPGSQALPEGETGVKLK